LRDWTRDLPNTSLQLPRKVDVVELDARSLDAR
jgi:hypothetical protein